jgi:hypothetical protein
VTYLQRATRKNEVNYRSKLEVMIPVSAGWEAWLPGGVCAAEGCGVELPAVQRGNSDSRGGCRADQPHETVNMGSGRHTRTSCPSPLRNPERTFLAIVIPPFLHQGYETQAFHALTVHCILWLLNSEYQNYGSQYLIHITCCSPWSTGHLWNASFHFNFLILYTVGRTPWAGDQPVARPLRSQDSTNTNADIRASSGIRIHDPGVWAGEDSSCLRSRGHCDRL